MEELKLKHTYLFQFGTGDIVSSVTILMITDKAYHVQWNRGIDSDNTWEQKRVFDRNYTMIEDITDFVVEKNDNIEVNPKIKLITCPVCKGFGTIPDEKSTGGTSPCPLCHGSKMIPESIEV